MQQRPKFPAWPPVFCCTPSRSIRSNMPTLHHKTHRASQAHRCPLPWMVCPIIFPCPHRHRNRATCAPVSPFLPAVFGSVFADFFACFTAFFSIFRIVFACFGPVFTKNSILSPRSFFTRHAWQAHANSRQASPPPPRSLCLFSVRLFSAFSGHMQFSCGFFANSLQI